VKKSEDGMIETSKITAHRAFQAARKVDGKIEPSHNRGAARSAFALICLLCALSWFQGLAALAAAVSFTPNPNTNGGNIIGRIPMTKLGNLKLPRGRAYFKSNELEVTAVPEFQFDRLLVLSGPILKCWSSIDGTNASINGIVYFQDGEWLKYIDESVPDKVITSNNVYTGQITGLKSGYLEVTVEGGQPPVKVAIADLQEVSSPRAYRFAVPVNAFLTVPQGQPFQGESADVSIKASSKIIALSAVKRDPLMQGDGDISKNKLIALWAGLSTVEALQFLPFAILEGPLRKDLVRQYHSRMEQSEIQSNTAATTSFQVSPRAPGAFP
jgi:hypothetical protein